MEAETPLYSGYCNNLAFNLHKKFLRNPVYQLRVRLIPLLIIHTAFHHHIPQFHKKIRNGRLQYHAHFPPHGFTALAFLSVDKQRKGRLHNSVHLLCSPSETDGPGLVSAAGGRAAGDMDLWQSPVCDPGLADRLNTGGQMKR